MDVVVASGINQNWTHLGVPSLPAMCTRYTQNKNAGMSMYVCVYFLLQWDAIQLKITTGMY